MNTATLIQVSGRGDAEIAAACGVNQSTAWRWRHGKVKPREADHIANLAALLGCHPRDIRPDLAEIFQ